MTTIKICCDYKKQAEEGRGWYIEVHSEEFDGVYRSAADWKKGEAMKESIRLRAVLSRSTNRDIKIEQKGRVSHYV